MNIRCFFSLVFGGLVFATATEYRDESACAVVSSSASAALVAATATPTVSAQLAYECLNSVPLGASEAIELVNSILPYVEWQSDIAYLKNPPEGYQEPALDLWAKFSQILDNINGSKYSNEYDFQVDLYNTFNAVHDGHFRFVPDLLSKAVAFRRPVQLVSVSRDGLEIPKIYFRDDLTDLINATRATDSTSSTNISSAVSALVKIDGQDAEQYIANFSQLGFLQDPDALYNNMFYEMAMDAQYQDLRYTGYFAGAGRFGNNFPGPNTTFQFENGTIQTINNYADVFGDFQGVTDGPSFYKKFCTGPIQQDADADAGAGTDDFVSNPRWNSYHSEENTNAYGYPDPQVISSDQQVSGYFLDDDPEYADIAVLSMLSFDPDSPSEFQSVIQTFLGDAKAAGKTKVVIDLSGNGGGIILLGYDAFRQFFPNIIQDGFSRFREHEAFNIMSEQISSFTADFSVNTSSSAEVFASTSPLNYRTDLNATNQNFLTYEDKFKSHGYYGDNYTNIMRWNLSDPLLTTNSSWGLGMTITGYGSRQNSTQPFAAENIVMVYDGYCASTCTIFSEFMHGQAGVKTIAFGGRPNNNSIQAVGGTKGANNYPFGYIEQLAVTALDSATPAQRANWSSVTAYTNLPQNRSTDNSINVRDNILRAHLNDGIPAQFLYEEADCRLFYEPKMLIDPRAIWKKAAAVAWHGVKCAVGGLPQVNETSFERKRNSEATKIRARAETKAVILSREDLIVGKWRSAAHGRKVPL